MSPLFIVILSVAGALLIAYFRAPKNHIAYCENYINQLPEEGLFAGLADYILDDDIFADGAFWNASGRLAGMWKRCDASVTLLRFVQTLTHGGLVTKQDRRGIVGRLIVQILFTGLGTIEAAICIAFDGLPHLCARVALQAATSLAARTYTLANVKGAPSCVSKLGELL